MQESIRALDWTLKEFYRRGMSSARLHGGVSCRRLRRVTAHCLHDGARLLPGDVLHLLHVLVASRPFGSGLFSSSFEPGSPLDSKEHAEALETEHARAWLLNRLTPVAAEAGVSLLLAVQATCMLTARPVCGAAKSLSSRRGFRSQSRRLQSKSPLRQSRA